MTDRSREGDQETAGGAGPEVSPRPVRRRFDAALSGTRPSAAVE